MGLFAEIASLHNENVRKGLTGGLYRAPMSVDPVDIPDLFNTNGSIKAPLPEGYEPFGLITDDGAQWSRSTDQNDVTAWQTNDPARSDLTKDVGTLKVTGIETNRVTIETFLGVDLSAPTLINGALRIGKPALPPSKYWRMLALAVDTIGDAEFVIARMFPRAKVTAWDDQAWNKTTSINWGTTFTSYLDSTLGESQVDFFGGSAFAPIATAMGFNLAPAGGGA
ncbi:hypothetical protein [Enterococcus hirae]|uniref:phage tail tube protein n=1 Tax=Enterococcus hirae TaxID=1354 RepID=UPI00136C7FE3|nr:hypothetical protein [Enterococcus hirae]NAE18053.1 hypothetical protein [Enterococcus hirae]